MGIDTHRIHSLLSNVPDIQKLMSIIAYKKLSPQLFIKLRAALRIFFEHPLLLQELHRLGLSEEDSSAILHLYNHLGQMLKDDEDFGEDMDFIRDGYNGRIDELRKIAYHSDELLLQYQQELSTTTGVANVKLKYVMNQGYFIEITNKDIAPFERNLEGQATNPKFAVVRRNTLKGAQRYVSEYLEQVQGQILEAKDELIAMEFSFLEQTRAKIALITKELTRFAEWIAWLDVYTSYALLSHEHGYTQPELSPTYRLDIVEGRHPVIEAFLPRDQQFIPNDLGMYEE